MIKRLPRLLLFLLALAGTIHAVRAQTGSFVELRSTGGMAEYVDGIGVFTNGIVATFGDATLSADSASYNVATGDIEASGSVVLQRGGALWRGEKLVYNFVTGEIRTTEFRAGMTPLFVTGDALGGASKTSTYSATNAVMTTDDVAEPSFRLRGRRMTVVPGEYVEFYDAVAYVGNVPVFWYPKYRRSLKSHPQHFTFTPGYRSFYGPYLLTTFRSYWTPELQTELRLDYRLERGPGIGPVVYYNFKQFGKATFDYYYTHDLDPGTNIFSGGPISEDRDRFKFAYDARPWTNFSVKAAVNYQRDSQFRRDFFEEEFQRDAQPISFLEVQRLWPNFSFNAYAQPQVNSFFDTIERLPDIRFTGARQQLGVSPIYYEMETSGGWYRRNYNGVPNFSAWRADTLHQLLLPQNFFGWLNVTPRASGRYTHYSEADGLGATTSSEDRFVFNTGVEVSTKASRVWSGATNGLLQVNGLRHILQPMVNYSFTPKPSAGPAQLPQFDYEQPSVRPLPIDFPDYNSIDAIDTENTFRLGLRNQLQTHREDGVDNLVDWWMFTDWRLDPRGAQTRFSDFFSQLDFRPRSWLTINSEIRYNFSEGVLKESNHGFVLQPGTRWSWALTHRYFYQDPLLPPDSDHNLFESRVYYRLNENWATRITQRFEARDGTMEEQYYTVYRDFRSFTTALTFRIRDQRSGPVDYTVAATLSLKAFPSFRVGSDSDLPQSLLGF